MTDGWLRRHVANAVTASRGLLTPFFLIAAGCAAHDGPRWPVATLFLVIAATDIVDGPIARRFGVVSDGGRVFDHTTDIVFVLSALCLYVWLGIVPWWVPAAVGCSFVAYRVDSAREADCARAARGPANRIGHWGGVANYVLIGIVVVDLSSASFGVSEGVLNGMFGVVFLLSLGSILCRISGAARA